MSAEFKDENTFKHCPKCAKTKLRSEFSLNRCRSDGRDDYCKPCAAINQKRARDRYRERNMRLRAEAAAAAEKSAA